MQTICDDGLGFGAVDDLPAFANRLFRRKFTLERGLKSTAAPNSLLVKWLKAKDLSHGDKYKLIQKPAEAFTFYHLVG